MDNKNYIGITIVTVLSVALIYLFFTSSTMRIGVTVLGGLLILYALYKKGQDN